jgi:hypothetical protein
MRKWIPMLLICLIFMLPAMAEDVFTIDASALDTLSAATQYLRVTYPVGDVAQVVSVDVINQDSSATVFSKFYGEIAGEFCSDDIYLKTAGIYQIHLAVGEKAVSFEFSRTLLFLSDNSAYSSGVPLLDEKTGTAVDLSAFGTSSYPIVASNKFFIGMLNVSVSADSLTVDYILSDSLDAQITSENLYIFTDLNDLISLSPSHLSLYTTFTPSSPISIAASLGGARYAVVYLPIVLSYDPNGLPLANIQPDPQQAAILEQLEILNQPDSVG